MDDEGFGPFVMHHIKCPDIDWMQSDRNIHTPVPLTTMALISLSTYMLNIQTNQLSYCSQVHELNHQRTHP